MVNTFFGFALYQGIGTEKKEIKIGAQQVSNYIIILIQGIVFCLLLFKYHRNGLCSRGSTPAIELIRIFKQNYVLAS